VSDAPLIIEFVGLSGAGKTTVAERVLARMRSQGLACADRQLIGGRGVARAIHYSRVAAFNLRNRQHIPLALRYGLAVKPFRRSRVRDALKLSAWAYRLNVARVMNVDVVLLDQGVVQQAWSPLLGGQLHNERLLCAALDSVLRSAQLSFAYVYFDVAIEVASERIASRPTMKSYFDGMAPAAAKTLLAAHKEHLERILAYAVDVTDAPCRRVDGNRSLDESCEDVARFVDQVTRR
jgi:thymidylate kinase